ncbi:MAG: glycosyltransferase family 4 protein [Planctomycetota bacterium]
MRIALVHQPWNAFLPPVEVGSIAIWNDRVAHCLVRRAHHEVLALGSTRETRATRREIDGIECHAIPLGLGPRIERLRERFGLDRDPRTPRLLSPGAYGGFQRRLVERLAALRPDVVHLQNLAQLAPPVRARLPRCRLILHMHCEWLSQLDPTWMARLIAPVDAIVCCSEAVAAGVRRAHPAHAGRTHVVPNGVDTAAFRPTPETHGVVRTLLFVGRISPEKGLHLLIPAFARLASQRPDLRLRIVGPDATTSRAILVDLSDDSRVRALARFYEQDYLAHLRALTAPLGARVEFAGGVPQRDLPGEYARATVVVQPSLYESFGMPVIEAMACGRAVVAARAGGLAELIEDGRDGLLAAPDDVDSLAAALARALDDDRLRAGLASAGPGKVASHFDWERVTDAVLRVYAPDP